MALFGQPDAAPRDEVLMIVGSIAELHPVRELTAEYVRSAGGDFPRAEMVELVRPRGGRLFLLNTSVPAKVEAAAVRNLRDSAALQSLFGSSGSDVRRAPIQLWVTVWVMAAMLGLALLRR